MQRFPIMKRSLFIYALLTLAISAQAQVARWLIRPAYEKIDFVVGADLVLADSAGTKVLWSFNGRRLASTTDELFPFADGHAVAVAPGSAQITTVYDSYGRSMVVGNYQVAANFPYFANGYLLVHDGRYLRYMNDQGKVGAVEYGSACPFNNGYASCFRYLNPQKMKDPLNQLLDTDLKPVPMKWEGKQFADGDIEFVSSVNDEGVGFVVAKHKVYQFNGQTKSLSPVFAKADETNQKYQVKIEGDLEANFVTVGDTARVLYARNSRNDVVEISFDALLIPQSITRNGEKQEYRENPAPQRVYNSQLKRFQGPDGKVALNWEETEVLPAQFKSIYRFLNDKAIVQMPNGKYGLLRVVPNDQFRISINEKKDMPFRHRTYATTLRLDMPPYIHASGTSIDIDPAIGINIDKVKKDGRDTNDGNYIEYPCEVSIPNGISTERKDYSYPMQVVYDGLRSPVINLNTKAWHYNYYSIDYNESDANITRGTLNITFDINASRLIGDGDYAVTFNLKTDSLRFEKEKVSETRYKCKVFDMREGTNIIYAVITEDGCPPFYFQFEVVYTKPAAGRSGSTNNVTIRRHPNPTPPPTPHLDI